MPPVEALVNIGEVCLPEVITNLATSRNGAERAPAIRVLIELRPGRAAADMLVEAIAQETDRDSRQRLHNSLDLLLQVQAREKARPARS